MDWFCPSYFEAMDLSTILAGDYHGGRLGGPAVPDPFVTLFSSLNQHDVRYLVVGGVAMNLHGLRRPTDNLDIVLEMGDANIERFLGAAHLIGLTPLVPVMMEAFAVPDNRKWWTEEKGMRALPVCLPEMRWFRLNILLAEPFDFTAAFPARKTVDHAGIRIHVAAAATLIDMKRRTGRETDGEDVKRLRRLAERE